jgi:predicted small integral membrane protein
MDPMPPAIVTILGYTGMAFGLVLFVMMISVVLGKWFGAWMDRFF